MKRKPPRLRHPQTGRLESPTAAETRIAVEYAERRPPTDEDAPPPTPFPGRKVTPTPGQLDLFGGVVDGGRERE